MTKLSMRLNPVLTAIVLSIVVAMPLGHGALLRAQSPPPSPQQLDQLLAPVALYPDSLLAQITTASTSPQEILDMDNWLQKNHGLTGTALTDAAEKQGFDAAFIALSNFPDVLDMMAQNIDDYAAIGQAFSADQGSVAASIQRLRAQAYAAGSLRSNEQQQVEVQQPAGQPIYVIQPVNPQVVYVPIYNPTLVYVRSSSTVVVIRFGPPVSISVLVITSRPWGWMGWGWNWGSKRCYYNHSVWVAWGNPYRPPVIWYHPRPVLYTARPGYGGNWGYRPPNYRPPVPGSRPPNRGPWGPNNRPGHNNPSTLPAHQPRHGRPAQPIARPGTPAPPNTTRPAQSPVQRKPIPPSSNNRPGSNPPSKPPNASQLPAKQRPPASPPRPTAKPRTAPPPNAARPAAGTPMQ